MEGTARSTNTSPTLEVEEQSEEVIALGIISQTDTTQVDTQENTLQPKSSEIEDTGVKKVELLGDQDTHYTEI